MKKNKGITLIALVITIIVLLILAGVSINMISGENGIIDKALKAAEETKVNSNDEKQKLKDTSDYIDEKVNQVNRGSTSNTNEYGFYFEREYVTTIDENKFTLIFYEDTSAKLYINSELAMNVPLGSIVYSSYKIDLSAIDSGIGIVSPNGKEINIDGIVFVLNENVINSLPAYIRITESQENPEILYANILTTIPKTPQAGDLYITSEYVYSYYTASPTFTNDFVGWEAQIGVSEFATILTQYSEISIREDLKSELKTGQEMSYGEILSYINNTPVIAVSFTNNTVMTVSPELPETIIDLEDAFFGCTSLKTITNLPSNLQSLHQTFYDCTSLESLNVSIPNTVATMDHTFMNCKSLTKAPNLPNNLIYMYGAFEGCTNLKTYEGSNNTNGDFSNYIIPENVTSMDYTFRNCYLITKAPVIPETVTALRETFSNCTSLIEAPVLPSQTTDIYSIFKNCTNLKTYTGSDNTNGDFSNYIIPENITTLDYVFENCSLLTKAPTLPRNARLLNGTFSNCTSLIEAPVIPESVQYMSKTFFNCTSLTGNVTLNTKAINSSSHAADYKDCFYGTIKPITLTGSCSNTIKSKIAATANNNNVSY